MEIDTLPADLAGDLDAAFPRLVSALQDGVYSGVLRMVGDAHDAEEIAQEAFLRAYRALRTYPPERIRDLRPAPWVWTIAINLCRNHYRTRARRGTPSPLPDDLAASDRTPEDEAANRHLGDALARHLAELPWEMRRAVVLRHVVGLPYEEIGEVLRRPVGTVKSDVHRGLARLRRTIPQEVDR